MGDEARDNPYGPRGCGIQSKSLLGLPRGIGCPTGVHEGHSMPHRGECEVWDSFLASAGVKGHSAEQ